MPFYTVKQGEALEAIVAQECGLIDVQSIIEHEKNEPLFAGRSHQQLREGDKLWLPDAEELPKKTVSVRTGSVAKLVVAVQKRAFKVRVCSQEHEPVAGVDYTLEVEGATLSGTTDSDGFVIQNIPHKARTAKLTIGKLTRELMVGGLDPSHTRTGVQARLSNLGYPLGPIDGKFGPKTLRAIKAFQHNHALKVDGHVGAQTRAKLLEVYGC